MKYLSAFLCGLLVFTWACDKDENPVGGATIAPSAKLTTHGDDRLSPPQGLTVAIIGQQGDRADLAFSWDRVSFANEYRLQLKSSLADDYRSSYRVIGQQYTIMKAASLNMAHSWRVMAIDDEYADSEWTEQEFIVKLNRDGELVVARPGEQELAVVASDALYCRDAELWISYCSTWGDLPGGGCGSIAACSGGAYHITRVISDTTFVALNPSEYGWIRFPQELPNAIYQRWVHPKYSGFGDASAYADPTHPDQLGLVQYPQRLQVGVRSSDGSAVYKTLVLYGFPTESGFGTSEGSITVEPETEVNTPVAPPTPDPVVPDSTPVNPEPDPKPEPEIPATEPDPVVPDPEPEPIAPEPDLEIPSDPESEPQVPEAVITPPKNPEPADPEPEVIVSDPNPEPVVTPPVVPDPPPVTVDPEPESEPENEAPVESEDDPNDSQELVDILKDTQVDVNIPVVPVVVVTFDPPSQVEPQFETAASTLEDETKKDDQPVPGVDNNDPPPVEFVSFGVEVYEGPQFDYAASSVTEDEWQHPHPHPDPNDCGPNGGGFGGGFTQLNRGRIPYPDDNTGYLNGGKPFFAGSDCMPYINHMGGFFPDELVGSDGRPTLSGNALIDAVKNEVLYAPKPEVASGTKGSSDCQPDANWTGSGINPCDDIFYCNGVTQRQALNERTKAQKNQKIWFICDNKGTATGTDDEWIEQGGRTACSGVPGGAGWPTLAADVRTEMERLDGLGRLHVSENTVWERWREDGCPQTGFKSGYFYASRNPSYVDSKNQPVDTSTLSPSERRSELRKRGALETLSIEGARIFTRTYGYKPINQPVEQRTETFAIFTFKRSCTTPGNPNYVNSAGESDPQASVNRCEQGYGLSYKYYTAFDADGEGGNRPSASQVGTGFGAGAQISEQRYPCIGSGAVMRAYMLSSKGDYDIDPNKSSASITCP